MMNDNKALERSGNITTHKVRMPHDLAIEAMQTILDYANDTKADLVFVIAASMALDALKREAQPNDPLTLEELRGMSNTDWVWVVFPQLQPEENCWYRAKKLYDLYSHAHYGETWFAYRRKPDGGGE